MSNSDQFATGPLAGVRVLDISTMLAGPYAGTLLGDLGADVIKVESHYGDDSRHLGPGRDGQHAPFIGLNRNKKSLVLDLRKEESREVFAKLLETTDVVICVLRVVAQGDNDRGARRDFAGVFESVDGLVVAVDGLVSLKSR